MPRHVLDVRPVVQPPAECSGDEEEESLREGEGDSVSVEPRPVPEPRPVRNRRAPAWMADFVN
ncbi:hypothetical protein E2C01_075763 [Portunus trituberculatus]|uniref:Uncharacterized protein n=1 Tax=Portunus trituberculatus TaxID=210409 RepID=A0A5B7IK07_PORTR|nr:hypothetical protein [Portunus trituberculatus]